MHPPRASGDGQRRLRSLADEVDRVERLLAAYEPASATGVAAIDFGGQMVDEPLATRARRIIALAD